MSSENQRYTVNPKLVACFMTSVDLNIDDGTGYYLFNC